MVVLALVRAVYKSSLRLRFGVVLVVLLQAASQRGDKRSRMRAARDDPCVDPRPAFAIILSKVDQKLKRVKANLNIVGVLCVRLRALV